MRYKGILWVVLSLLCLNLASAYFVTEITSEKNNIFPWEEALFTIQVTNRGDETDQLTYIYPVDTEWSLISDPMYVKRTVEPGRTIETQVRLKPFNQQKIDFKQYELEFMVKSDISGETDTGTFTIFVRDPNMVYDYLPIVNIDVDAPASLDPRDQGIVEITLDNKNRLNITDYTIEITSELNPANDKVVVVAVPPVDPENPSKPALAQTSFTIDYDDRQVPTTDTLIIKASIPSKNKIYDPIVKTVEILPYSKVTPKTESKDSFLKSDTTITFYNEGNVATVESYRQKTSLFRQIYTQVDPKVDAVPEAGYRYYTWSLEIGPREVEEIHITVNYRPLVVVFLLIIVAIVCYFVFRSPLVVRKETRSLSPDSDKGLSRAKVLIHIKNRKNRVVENIQVVDKIPHIASIEKEFAIGTVQPSNIVNNDKKGTIVKWQIESLEPFEERIISYQIISKLEVVGSLKLSSAMVKYKNARGTVSKSYSNTVLAE